MTRNLLRAGALSCALLTSTALTAPAAAQTFGVQERQAPDENGVDVISGRLSVPLRSVNVGRAESGLTYASGWADGRFFDSFALSVAIFPNQPAVITIFGEAKRFTDNGDGTWTNLDGDGASFVTTASGYVFTERDGTAITFLNSLGDTGWLATIVARVSTIARPDGEVLTYHHRLEPGLRQCDAQFNCVFVPPGGRVQSVTSNLGYQLKAGYAANTWHTDGTSNSEFSRLTEVTAINNAVDYCDPAADTCTGLTQAWPELSLGMSASGGVTTRTFTDPLGNAVTTTETSGRVTSVTSPEDAAADLTITYDASNRVDTLTRGGGTWDYGYSDSGSTRTTTVAQPLGGTRTYVSDLTLDRVTSVTDELGRTTSFQYDSFGRVTRVTAPEGHSVSYTYDARGNVTATRRREEGDTGDTGDDIVTSASFPSTCSNPVTCNLPTSATDARGNVTEFTYDATHGGVLTVTAPAPTSGATRPQVRYSYAQRSAWYKNSAGSIVQAPSAVYRVTAISSCQTGSSPSCLGTADEVKTTIDYGTGSSSQANSLWIRSVSSGSGNGSLTATSAMAYDSVGNLTSVDGPLAGTADTSGFRYDALRRPTMIVSPTPMAPARCRTGFA